MENYSPSYVYGDTYRYPPPNPDSYSSPYPLPPPSNYPYSSPDSFPNPHDQPPVHLYPNRSGQLDYSYPQPGLQQHASSQYGFSETDPPPSSPHPQPDIAAPGINILASYTPLQSLTGLEGDTQFSKFILMSGTSMACPHVAGVAAYIKSFHPGWSPAAVKSSIITTATHMSPKVNNDAEFAYGAGQVNPLQAVHPGLIFDMDQLSYIQFLCHEGYGNATLGIIVGTKSVNCSTLPPSHGSDALNYPTMQVTVNSSRKPITAVFRRRVTNVGLSQSKYNATINAPKGVQITVRPLTLSFNHRFQKKSFTVVVKVMQPSNQEDMLLSGSLVWNDSHHTVRSPIVIYKSDDTDY